MSDRVDRLFEGDPELPTRPSHAPRIQLVLAAALVLDLLGLLTCLSIPGAALTLWAWWWVGRELAAAAAGVVATEHAPRLHLLQRLATAGLAWCAASFALQIYLLSTGAYERWFRELDTVWR